MTEFRRVPLKTGITLNVALAGNVDKPAVILLHGFPESHRTWREIAPRLQRDFRLIMPDQRGFAGSDQPRRPTLTKRTCSWTTSSRLPTRSRSTGSLSSAMTGAVRSLGPPLSAADPRLTRLAIINAPHPVLFQKSLIESTEQRAASQYINVFRAPGFEKVVEAKGFEWLFEQVFSGEVDLAKIPEAEKRQYIAEWSQPGALTAMLNWYRASQRDRAAAGRRGAFA